MKYFNQGDILLSDFDGVYKNSQERFDTVMKDHTELNLWMEYLNSIDWHSFLRECDYIPEARETLLELQKLNILKGFITTIHSFYEGEEKTKILREDGFYVPVFFVLPEQPKTIVFPPTPRTIILEDKRKNALEWEKEGGKSILYNPQIDHSSKSQIKKLSHLLKK